MRENNCYLANRYNSIKLCHTVFSFSSLEYYSWVSSPVRLDIPGQKYGINSIPFKTTEPSSHIQ